MIAAVFRKRPSFIGLTHHSSDRTTHPSGECRGAESPHIWGKVHARQTTLNTNEALRMFVFFGSFVHKLQISSLSDQKSAVCPLCGPKKPLLREPNVDRTTVFHTCRAEKVRAVTLGQSYLLDRCNSLVCFSTHEKRNSFYSKVYL